MRKEENRTEYTTLKGFLNHKIFKQKLELVLVSKELQVTYPPEDVWYSNQIERFEIINILVRAGKRGLLQITGATRQ